MESTMVTRDELDKVERKARNGFGMGLAGVLTGGYALLNGGLGNLFGGSNSGTTVGSPTYTQNEIDYISRKQCEDYIELTKGIYDQRILTMNQMTANRERDVQEKFGLYQNDNANAKALQSQIDELKTATAVQAAIQPYQMKLIQNQINDVAKDARYGLNFEAYKRCCADNSLQLYMNSTFVPKEVADVTVGTTTTPMAEYNPLPNCGCGCGCGVNYNSLQFAI